MMLERRYDQWLPGLYESAGDSKVTCPDEANQTHPLPNFGSVLSHFQVDSLRPFFLQLARQLSIVGPS
jgi:hypothetical protein